MLGEDHFQHRATHLDNLGIFGCDFHALLQRGAAGAQHLCRVLDPHNTDAAGRGGIEILVFAECGNVDGNLSCRIEDGGSRVYFDRESVDNCLNHSGGVVVEVTMGWN